MRSPCRLAACGVLMLAATCVAATRAQDGQGLLPVPPLTARVTDTTGTLTAAQKAALEAKLEGFERTKGAQVAVLMVPTTQPEDIAQYSIRVAEAWKLGRAQPDDGALLLVAKDDRRLRIEVGYGLEGVLPDAIASRIIRETIAPRLQQGDYYGGIDAGVDRLLAVIRGEALPPPEDRWQGEGAKDRGAQLLPMLFFGVIAVSGILRAIFGRGLEDLGVVGQAEVVVRPQHDPLLAFDDHHGVFRLRDGLEVRIEPGGPDLVDLGIVTALVEQRDVWGRLCGHVASGGLNGPEGRPPSLCNRTI